MFIKLLNKFRKCPEPKATKTSTKAKLKPKSESYWAEKKLVYLRDLRPFWTYCERAGAENVYRPIAWSEPKGGHVSTIWKQKSLFSVARQDEASQEQRVEWVDQLIESFEAVGVDNPLRVPDFQVAIDEKKNCVIDLSWQSKIEVSSSRGHACIFHFDDIFWLTARALPEEVRDDFICQHWLGVQVYSLFTKGRLPYKDGYKWAVAWFRSFRDKTQDWVKPEFLESPELSPEVTSVLKRMVSPDVEDRFADIGSAITELKEAIAHQLDFQEELVDRLVMVAA